MRYYLIFKRTGDPNTKANYPSYITEHKDVAEDFCEEYPEFYYDERDTGSFISTTGLSSAVYDDSCLGKGLYSDIVCPYCGAKHFRLDGCESTAMYCPTIIKDGKVISKDHNTVTEYFRCQECGKRFKKVGNEIEKIGE